MGKYILDLDETEWQNYLDPWRAGKWLGWGLMVLPPDQQTSLDYTGFPGDWNSLYYSMVFWLYNNEYHVEKVDESIEISPTHVAYYQKVLGQKDALGSQIKAGIDEIIKHVGDLELLRHDLRRYKEILNYFKEKDEHSLKAMFIDQVDFHAGEGAPGRLSMSFMQQRGIFPTIIQDFFAMQSEEDLEKNPRLKDLPEVEKDVLRTKFRAYQEWKQLFGREVESRVEELERLIRSKEELIGALRSGLKPKIARYMLIEEGLKGAGARRLARTFPVRPGTEATASYAVRLWAWKEFFPPEYFKSGEIKALRELRGIRPDDDFTMKNLILSERTGLRAKFKWIGEDEKWLKTAIEEAKKALFTVRRHGGGMRGSAIPKFNAEYYVFFDLIFERTNILSARGDELEDVFITVRAYLMSQNVVLTKMLEVLAIREEFEQHVNTLLGLGGKVEKEEGKEETQAKVKGKSKFFDTLSDAFRSIGLSFRLARFGPYDKERERIIRFYLSPMGRYFYRPLVKTLKAKIMR